MKARYPPPRVCPCCGIKNNPHDLPKKEALNRAVLKNKNIMQLLYQSLNFGNGLHSDNVVIWVEGSTCLGFLFYGVDS